MISYLAQKFAYNRAPLAFTQSLSFGNNPMVLAIDLIGTRICKMVRQLPNKDNLVKQFAKMSTKVRKKSK